MVILALYRAQVNGDECVLERGLEGRVSERVRNVVTDKRDLVGSLAMPIVVVRRDPLVVGLPPARRDPTCRPCRDKRRHLARPCVRLLWSQPGVTEVEQSEGQVALPYEPGRSLPIRAPSEPCL